MAASTLLDLERAELAARERRLSAEAEAERMIGDARGTVATITSGVEQAISRAVAKRRRTLLAQARREVRAIELQIKELGSERTPTRDPARERATRLVVAAVLAEPADEEG